MGETLSAVGATAVKAIAAAAAMPVIVLLRFTFFIFCSSFLKYRYNFLNADQALVLFGPITFKYIGVSASCGVKFFVSHSPLL
jgi:hypothetical protein